MLYLLSPAKSLDYDSEAPSVRATMPKFLDQSAKLADLLKKLKPVELEALMGISTKLAELNAGRFDDWRMDYSKPEARQAILAFTGDVYQGLSVDDWDKEDFAEAQKSIRILSGLYGLIKPLDLIQPYRLEMGTSLKVNSSNNLYEFWGSSITDYLNQEMVKDELLVNLASKEYFKAVQSKNLQASLVTPIFKDYKNGKLKIISFFAKKARGQMARYILDNGIETLNELKGFDIDGYGFSAEYTLNENEPVFVR